jgi:hypothetical protein
MRPAVGNVGQPTKKEWRRPELRKLPIEATSTTSGKPGVNAAENAGGPKQADGGGQFS